MTRYLTVQEFETAKAEMAIELATVMGALEERLAQAAAADPAALEEIARREAAVAKAQVAAIRDRYMAKWATKH